MLLRLMVCWLVLGIFGAAANSRAQDESAQSDSTKEESARSKQSDEQPEPSDEKDSEASDSKGAEQDATAEDGEKAAETNEKDAATQKDEEDAAAKEPPGASSKRGPAKAGDKAPAPPAGPLLAQFKKEFVEWRALLRSLNSLGAKYKLAKKEDRPKIKEEYRAEVAKGEEQLQALIKLGQSAFAESPNSDQELAMFLASHASDLVEKDLIEQGLEEAMFLVEHGLANDRIYGLAGYAAFAANKYEQANELLLKAKESKLINSEREGQIIDSAEKYVELWKTESEIRAKEAAENLPQVKFTTTKGDLVVELFENEAPNTVASFISLVKAGYYDKKSFHRVIANFMAQAGGNEDGTTNEGPGYKIKCECYADNARMHFRGSLSMAHAGRDTGGGEFFITYRATPHLNKLHTVFGRLVEGFDVLPKLIKRNPLGSGSDGDAAAAGKDQSQRHSPPDLIIKAEVLRDRGHAYTFDKIGN